MSQSKPMFVSFLLDETGSMQSIKEDTIGGFNAHLETLRRNGGDIVFSLVSFNSSEIRKRYVAEPIEKIRPLTEADYQPKAMTPLIDAAVKMIKATAEAVAKRTDDPAVVVVMQTDGLENVSVEYDSADLALLIKEKEQAGWQFMFLGAGLDAFAAARHAGVHIDAARVVSYDRGRSRQVFDVVSDNLVAFASSRDVASLSFRPEQRASVGDHADPQLDADASKPPRTRASGAGGKSKPRQTKAQTRNGRRGSTVDDLVF
jgi:hypothetical protein